MKSVLPLVALAAAVALGSSAALATTNDSPWKLRVRATYLLIDNQSDAFTALGTRFTDDAIRVSDKLIPEVNISYHFNKNFAAELVLTYPQQHRVSLAGIPLGTFRHLPPTLLAQYHFAPDAAFQPYVGAGLNLTLISNVRLAVPGTAVRLDLDSASVGAALQAGFDFAVGDGWHLNADAKWVQIGSDVTVIGGPRLTKVRLDPWLLSLGVGYRF